MAGYNEKTIQNDINLKDSITVNYSKNIFNIPFPKSIFISKMFLSSKAIMNFKPGVIYERNFNCYVGALLSKVFRIPLVVEINGLIDEEIMLQGNKINNSKTKRMILNWIRRKSFNQAKAIVAVTDGIKNEIQSIYYISPEKIHVVANGANIDMFKPMDQNEAKEELGLNIKNKYVCFVGNLAPWQGVDYLIRAAPLILKIVPDTRFLIVGDGMMMDEWRKMAMELNVNNNFLFTGVVPFEMVPKYINASDICVAPFIRARNEKIGLSPLKIYEYLACGKPVVASDIKGVVDLLNKSKGGMATPSDKSIKLADSIVTLLQNENLMAQMGMNGREYVIRNHSWTIVAKNVAVIYENVVQKL